MNVFRKNNYLKVSFSDNQEYITNECTEELWEMIKGYRDEEELLKDKLFGESKEYTGDIVRKKIGSSKLLTLRGNSIYMLEVSELSIPEDFALNVLKAEEADDIDEIRKFKNFWTLVSLNPDSRVRDNIFWFIRRWGIQISDSGLLIAYRNAVLKTEGKYSTDETKEIINTYYQLKYIAKEDPYKHIIKGVNIGEAYDEIVNGDSSPIYTDQHSHSTKIVLGKPVSMPREECDCDSNVSCSRGLHAGAKGWLKRNYFGEVGMQVLVNPAKVTAIPTIDDYGKLRCCEYFPVALIDFDEDGEIIEKPYSLHNDVAYLEQIKYSGDINNDDYNHYELSATYETNEDLYDSILIRLKSSK